MKFDILLTLVCVILVPCAKSLCNQFSSISVSCFPRLQKLSLSSQSIPTHADTNNSNIQYHDKTLPKWLISRNMSPPYWLLSDDLPAWFFAGGPPKWLSEKGFKPPVWILQDEIPPIITASYGSEGPPLWILNMDKLPHWFNEVDILPYWLLDFRDVCPPKWALNDSIPDWLMRGEILSSWVDDEGEVKNVNRWLHNVDEKYPKWIIEGTYPSWLENIPNRMKEMEPLGFLKEALMCYKVIYSDMLVPPEFIVPNKDSWPNRLWGMKLGKAVNLIKEQFLYVDRWDDLLSIGFFFNDEEEERALELFHLNRDMYGNDTKKVLLMKAAEIILKSKAADAYSFNEVTIADNKQTEDVTEASVDSRKAIRDLEYDDYIRDEDDWP